MAYFTRECLGFFEGLSIDNSKAYFDEHRRLYQEEVRAPFTKLVGDLIARVAGYEPGLTLAPKDAIFRINRDIRFSKDKSPYKTHAGALISSRGRRDLGWPGFYIQLSHEQFMVAGGAYMPDREGVQRIRTRIARDPEGFASVIGGAAFKRMYGGLQGDRLKRIPREFQEAFQAQPLVANKQWYFMAEMEPELALRDDLLEVLMEHYVAANEVSEFLRDALRCKHSP